MSSRRRRGLDFPSAFRVIIFFISLPSAVSPHWSNYQTIIMLPTSTTAAAAAAALFAIMLSTSSGAATPTGANNSATGWNAVAFGMNSAAEGNLAAAFGFNVSAGANSSVAMGVNSRTVSDRNVPGGSSGGGAFVVGKDATAVGDWSQVCLSFF